VIDPRESQVFERRLAQILKDAVVRGLRRKRAGLHVLEECMKLGAIHRAKWLGFLDFQSSRALT
jgi:hypothetical protein